MVAGEAVRAAGSPRNVRKGQELGWGEDGQDGLLEEG